MPPQIPVRGLVFDLGDVLFTWSRSTKTTISPGTLKKILSSSIWYEYERGKISQSICYELVALEFSLEASEVAEAFSQARASLQPDPTVVKFLKNLRRDSSVKIFAMSNVAIEDFASLSDKMDPSIFHQVFTSGEAGMRKPDLGFYRQVLEKIDLAPEQVVFVDDKHENVLAANNLGIRGLVFDKSTLHTLQSIFQGPVAKAHDYLYRHAKDFDSITDSGVRVGDNFAKLLILEATQDPNLVGMPPNPKGIWNFFTGEATLVPGGYFPDDLDTTSLGLMVLPPEQPGIIETVLDRMAKFVTSDGLFLTYFDLDRPRTDAVVSANVLACFYRYGRGHQLPRTLQHIHDVLLHQKYEKGTRYYPSPDCCLGFFERLLQSSTDIHLRSKLGSLIKSRVQERVGKSGSALDLSMRVLACNSLGIECSADRDALISMQCSDGSWEPGWMYRYGSTGVRVGNRGVTTALAAKAIASSANAAGSTGMLTRKDRE